MQRKEWMGVLLVVALLFAVGGRVLAVSTDPANPEVLIPERPVTAVLPGSPAGEFHFYAIPYPGNGSVVTIRMTYTPGDPVTREVAGFKVYAPNGFLIGEGLLNGERVAAARSLRYADNTPATWLIQVYNYSRGQAIDYRLEFEGLPVPAPTAVPGPTPVPGTEIFSILDRDARFDTLTQVLQTAGLADTLRGPGPYTLLAPTDAAFDALPAEERQALLADPARLVTVLQTHVAQGLLPASALRGVSSLGTVSGVSLPVGLDGQVLRVGGAGVVAADITASNGLIHAIDRVLLDIGGAAAPSGAVVGNRAGAFGEHRVALNAGAQVDVTVDIRSGAPPSPQAVGLNVYGPQGLVTSDTAESDPAQLRVTFTAEEQGVYLFQVFNYDPGYTLEYTLTRR
ncbi:MAG: fasciclin domain-containing protein [Chloroflexi bacterium]|nr:fasciclin domain-containing protein [Chloroflexota bacterium]